jgi:hypothetical protein
MFQVVKGIVSNLDPSGLVKAADGVGTLVSGVTKQMSGEEDGLGEIATGGGKVLAGVGTFLGFIKTDTNGDSCDNGGND